MYEGSSQHTKAKRTKSGRYTKDITKEEIEGCFSLPSEEACKRLGIGLTILKRLCRRFGIVRWPYRRLKQEAKVAKDIVPPSSDEAAGSSGESGANWSAERSSSDHAAEEPTLSLREGPEAGCSPVATTPAHTDQSTPSRRGPLPSLRREDLRRAAAAEGGTSSGTSGGSDAARRGPGPSTHAQQALLRSPSLKRRSVDLQREQVVKLEAEAATLGLHSADRCVGLGRSRAASLKKQRSLEQANTLDALDQALLLEGLQTAVARRGAADAVAREQLQRTALARTKSMPAALPLDFSHNAGAGLRRPPLPHFAAAGRSAVAAWETPACWRPLPAHLPSLPSSGQLLCDSPSDVLLSWLDRPTECRPAGSDAMADSVSMLPSKEVPDRQGSHPLGWDRGEGLEVTSSALPRALSPPPSLPPLEGLGLAEAEVDELASPFAAFATFDDDLGADGDAELLESFADLKGGFFRGAAPAEGAATSNTLLLGLPTAPAAATQAHGSVGSGSAGANLQRAAAAAAAAGREDLATALWLARLHAEDADPVRSLLARQLLSMHDRQQAQAAAQAGAAVLAAGHVPPPGWQSRPQQVRDHMSRAPMGRQVVHAAEVPAAHPQLQLQRQQHVPRQPQPQPQQAPAALRSGALLMSYEEQRERLRAVNAHMQALQAQHRQALEQARQTTSVAAALAARPPAPQKEAAAGDAIQQLAEEWRREDTSFLDSLELGLQTTLRGAQNEQPPPPL